MAARMSAPSCLMAYASVDPTPATPPHHRHRRNASTTSLHLLPASSARGFVFLMDRRLAGSRMETVRASSPPQRVRATLLSPEYHVGKRGEGRGQATAEPTEQRPGCVRGLMLAVAQNTITFIYF
jgi:hypothetical protein